MEFHPVQQGVVSDRAGVGGPLAQGFPVAFPAAADVAWRDGGKGHQFHGVDLDPRGTGAIPAPGPDFGPAPQPEGHGDVARRHGVPQVLAELHPTMLRLLPPGRQRARGPGRLAAGVGSAPGWPDSYSGAARRFMASAVLLQSVVSAGLDVIKRYSHKPERRHQHCRLSVTGVSKSGDNQDKVLSRVYPGCS